VPLRARGAGARRGVEHTDERLHDAQRLIGIASRDVRVHDGGAAAVIAIVNIAMTSQANARSA